jgi:hypothetical protein
LTNSWPTAKRKSFFLFVKGKGRKRRPEEHISEAQRPSDITQNHIAFEHRRPESETHGVHSPPSQKWSEKSRQIITKEHLEATEATGSGSQQP